MTDKETIDFLFETFSSSVAKMEHGSLNKISCLYLFEIVKNQGTQIAELTRKVEILKELCQEQTKLIDQQEAVIAKNSRRIGEILTMIDNTATKFPHSI